MVYIDIYLLMLSGICWVISQHLLSTYVLGIIFHMYYLIFTITLEVDHVILFNLFLRNVKKLSTLTKIT